MSILRIDNPQHTEVLGYRCNTQQGRKLWRELDWTRWLIDGPDPNWLSHGGLYFHVGVKSDPDARYRVRCWYSGGNYRGRKVVDIGMACVAGKLCWVVRTEKAKASQ